MSTGAEARLQQLGITLPAPPTPGGNYVPAKTVGHMVYLSGVISTSPDGVITGTAGADKTATEANAAARACALLHLAMLKRHLGSLDAVKSVVTVNGYVNAVPGFPDSPAVINGASDLFIEISVSPAATSAPQSAYPRSRATPWSNCKPPWRSSERHNGRTLPFRRSNTLSLESRASPASHH